MSAVSHDTRAEQNGRNTRGAARSYDRSGDPLAQCAANLDFAGVSRERTLRPESAHCASALICQHSFAVRPGRTVRLLSCPPNWAVGSLLPCHKLLLRLIIAKPASSRATALGLDCAVSWS